MSEMSMVATLIVTGMVTGATGHNLESLILVELFVTSDVGLMILAA